MPQKNTKHNYGALCISLDYEKFWGIHDIPQAYSKAKKFEQITVVIERILKVFDKYNIHATWATVGLLLVEDKKLLTQLDKECPIDYSHKTFSPFPLQKKLEHLPTKSYSGKPEAILIKNTAGQELASHTFSHYYTLEEGQDIKMFHWDLHSNKLANDAIKNKCSSIIFPRNQINPNYLSTCKKNGIKAFRGNQIGKLWKNEAYSSESIKKKVLRTMDAYLPIEKSALYPWETLDTQPLVNIPASRFLRPFNSKLSFLEPLKMQRIKFEMTKAAKQNKIYHLWWHPHNFLSNIEKNMTQLDQLCKHYTYLKEENNFQTLNMQEIAESYE